MDCNTILRGKIWSVNALLLLNAILAAVMAGIGAYAHHYRHRPFTRSIYDGATFLFLPIMSYVFSQIGYHIVISFRINGYLIVADCYAGIHMLLVLLWTGLVQIVAINTSTIVVVDKREGRSIAPQVVLLVQAVWTSYLAAYNAVLGRPEILPVTFGFWVFLGELFIPPFWYLLPFVIICAKMIIKLYAFYKAQRSLALGRNPHLIIAYMEQLQANGSQHAPPPLLVMGDETAQIEKQPHGYRFRWMPDQGDSGLVTVDRVWQLDDMILGQPAKLKDVCLSFALFKLLRCRFARYSIDGAGFEMISKFFWHVLLKDSNDRRVVEVITDELSFLYDYYYSSLSISYPNLWLPILSIFISVLSIAYCLLFAVVALGPIIITRSLKSQVFCETDNCDGFNFEFGSLSFDIVPVYLLAALVVLTEVREIASYICSNWTKATLICCYINNASWQQSPTMQKWVRRVLQCRCKLLKHWQDKMNQCSILVLQPRRTTPVTLLRHLIPGAPDDKKNIMVPRAVKTLVIDTLRSYEGSRSNGVIPLPRGLQFGGNFHWAFSVKSTADTMLVCHIATSILEVRYPNTASDHKVAAIHLSRYCAYLVGYCPELLPDDDAWCKSLYKHIKKGAKCASAIAGRAAMSTPQARCQQLVELLSAESNHEVLRNGAKLGEKLAELEETAWELVARFWSELLLYVAPSDNLDGHADAIARGGELITLLWALLAHVGIVGRIDTAAAATDGAPPAV